MTGPEFNAARRRLGYSLRDMTIALGLSPASVRTVRRYEQEGPPPRVAERVRGLLDAADDAPPPRGAGVS